LTALLFAQLGWTVALGAGVASALLGATLWLFIRADEPLDAHGYMEAPGKTLQSTSGA
jgi:hypothetical protein